MALASPARCPTASRSLYDLQPKFLIYGKNGWIGGLVGELLKKEGADFEYGTARLEDRAAIIADLERVRTAGPRPGSFY